jgi:hemolysin activation/secretion protein
MPAKPALRGPIRRGNPKRPPRRLAAFILLGLLGLPAPAPAQTPGERDLIRERQQRLLDQQRRRLDELQQLPQQTPAAPVPPDTAQPARPPSPDGGCLPVRRIRLQGATLIPEARQRQILAPFEGRCLDPERINQLLKQLTQYYLDRGDITTRAYLPEQHLAEGELTVQIIEGRLDGFERGPHAPGEREIAMTFPGKIGQRLQLRELEQMLDQLARLPSRQTRLDILPGQTPGGSRVALESEAIKPWRIQLRHDNNGDKSTGERQWTLGLAWDSPLGLADQLSLSGGREADTRRWPRANHQHIAYELPWGWWNLRYHYGQNYYQSRAQASGLSFETHGQSRTHQLTVERLLHRDGRGKTGVSLGLMRQHTRNDFEDIRLDISSQRLSEFQIGLTHGRRLGNGFLNLELGWQRGIGALDAQSRGHPHGAQPDARYDKSTLILSVLRPFTVGGQDFSMESVASGQHSRDALYSPQRVSLGGAASVRGFKEHTLTGNSGGYWRNQLRWRRTVGWQPLKAFVSDYSVALAWDIGAIARNSRRDEAPGRMSGNAIELTAQGPWLSASLTFARALEHPSEIERERPVYFNIGLTY